MNAPDPSLLPPTAAAPGRAAAALTRALTARGITGIITAATQEFAVISVTADVTIWTDGTRLWCTSAASAAPGQPRTLKPPPPASPPSRALSLTPDRPRAPRRAITNRNPDDALTDHTVLFRTRVRAEQSSHLVHR